MTDMDIARMWRTLRRDPADVPHPGAHQETAVQGITTSLSQECLVALPPSTYTANLVTVTVTSLRPGVAGHVTLGTNLNSLDGSYQGPTTNVGQGDFNATSSQVTIRFVVLPWTGFPVLGYGAAADWADGEPESFALNYVRLECNPWVWWGSRWWPHPTRIAELLTRPFARTEPPRSGAG